ncbi:hypothetical protein BO78DRAFT_422390 [Aspergillus sclerotiicarbonarius CBS 121057]|uniref:DNA2/NAM7 helicase helicase domain-containing protein n=1 Tax=Aspergillus sclerotiicarbonarius (strain CBS 121057 / IBT 28362) TaxID=1448318 RepID=A0A319DXR8_ASPSB|nr:hypothetical protein BO78DRAFT_422390 [Aspergillus sclerotiicarbonarius CBS 121057]
MPSAFRVCTFDSSPNTSSANLFRSATTTGEKVQHRNDIDNPRAYLRRMTKFPWIHTLLETSPTRWMPIDTLRSSVTAPAMQKSKTPDSFGVKVLKDGKESKGFSLKRTLIAHGTELDAENEDHFVLNFEAMRPLERHVRTLALQCLRKIYSLDGGQGQGGNESPNSDGDNPSYRCTWLKAFEAHILTIKHEKEHTTVKHCEALLRKLEADKYGNVSKDEHKALKGDYERWVKHVVAISKIVATTLSNVSQSSHFLIDVVVCDEAGQYLEANLCRSAIDAGLTYHCGTFWLNVGQTMTFVFEPLGSCKLPRSKSNWVVCDETGQCIKGDQCIALICKRRR